MEQVLLLRVPLEVLSRKTRSELHWVGNSIMSEAENVTFCLRWRRLLHSGGFPFSSEAEFLFRAVALAYRFLVPEVSYLPVLALFAG